MQYKKPKATLLYASPLATGEIAGRICYNSFNLSENRLVQEFSSDPEGFIKNLETMGDIESSELLDTLINVYFHESVAEHINLSFHVSRVSREVIIEWNRHRIGVATSQKSSRYTIEDLVNAWVNVNNLPYGIKYIKGYTKEYKAFSDVVARNTIHADKEALRLTTDYLYNMLSLYNKEQQLKSGLTGGAKKKQNDRVKRCLPESWMAEGIWTFNLRSLKHFYELRSSGSAYYGIQEVAEAIIKQVPNKYRLLIDKKFKKEQDKLKD